MPEDTSPQSTNSNNDNSNHSNTDSGTPNVKIESNDIAVGAQRRKRRQPTRNPTISQLEPGQSLSSQSVSSTSDTTITASMSNTNTLDVQQPSTSTQDVKPDVKKKAKWDDTTASYFFDAIKIHGKDFEQILKYMNRNNKGVKRGYEQVRNYYYNTSKSLSNLTNPDLPDSDKAYNSAKELFLLVNYAEWKRRTGKDRIFDRLKFVELVKTGSVSLRVRGKVVTIRTPHCPSLRPLCEDGPFPNFTGKTPLQSSGFACTPSELVYTFTPLRFGDKSHVLNCEQNPNVRAVLRPNQPLKSIIQFLQRKWVPQIVRQKNSMISSEVSGQPKVLIRLAEGMQLSAVTVSQATQRPSAVCYSLDRYRELAKEKAELEQQQLADNANNNNNNSIEQSVSTSNDATTNQDEANEQSGDEDRLTVDCCLVGGGQKQEPQSEETKPEEAVVQLTEQVLIDTGLNEHNCSLTAGQLAFMCHWPATVRMTYEIVLPDGPAVIEQPSDPWSSFMTLLLRGFTDELVKLQTIGDDQPMAKCRRRTPTNQQQIRQTRTPEIVIVNGVVDPGQSHTVVASENAQFTQQIAGMFSSKIKRRCVYNNPLNPVPIAPRPSTTPPPLHQPVVIVSTNSTHITNTLISKTEHAPIQVHTRHRVADQSANSNTNQSLTDMLNGDSLFGSQTPSTSINLHPTVNSNSNSIGHHDLPSYIRTPMQQLTDEGSRDFLARNVDDRFVQQFTVSGDSNSSLLCTPSKNT